MSRDLIEPEAPTFVETALAQGGKSVEESRSTGRLDRADEQVEALFDAKHQTAASPIHRAVWDREAPLDLFLATEGDVPADCRSAMDSALAIAARHRTAGTLYDDRGKIADPVLADLAGVGYWGLLVDREYGGLGAPFAAFARFLTKMATIDPTVAGLASVHGCIGAVDPLRTFGTAEQKRRFLPGLASGERLSGFALTEPGAGSDLTALRTRAERDGDEFVVKGEKLFITNAVPGRTIGLVCLVENRPAVLIVELPPTETEEFRLVRYGLHALRRAHNNGLVFRGLRVPAANLLWPAKGDGLTIAYHGLNLGRVALCAAAAGSMRSLLAGMLPWARFRRTYGAPIAARELVRRRIARLAGLIVGADAMTAWCGGLLDAGYRGELECIVAKIFGSESQKEAAVELAMKTHGGRAFLHGHPFGDNVHEYLAPCIYEGEGEILGMAFFKALIKHHGTTYFEPVGRAMAAAGLKRLDPRNPAHLWALRNAAGPYARWKLAQMVAGRRDPGDLAGLPPTLADHARAANDGLYASRLEIDSAMSKHQLKLADRQGRVAELSQRIQDRVVMLVAARWAANRDEISRDAADLLGRDLARKLSGRRPTDADFRDADRLGAAIAEQGWSELEGIEPDPILMPYPAAGL